MYAAAAVCVIGALLPESSMIAGLKTIGLLAGIILSMSNRNRNR